MRERCAPTLAPGGVPDVQPLISVIIPARDEAKRIGNDWPAWPVNRTDNLRMVGDDHRLRDCGDCKQLLRRSDCAEGLPIADAAAGWAAKVGPAARWTAPRAGDWAAVSRCRCYSRAELLAALLARAESRLARSAELMPFQQLGSLPERDHAAFLRCCIAYTRLTKFSDPRSPLAFANGNESC